MMPVQVMNTGLPMSTMAPNTMQAGASIGYDFSGFPVEHNLGVWQISFSPGICELTQTLLTSRTCLL